MIKQHWRQLSPQGRAAAVASAAAIAVWLAVWFVPDGVTETEPRIPAPSAQLEHPVTPATPTEPVPARPVQPVTAPSAAERSSERPLLNEPALAPADHSAVVPEVDETALVALRAGLASDNSGTRIEALREVAKARAPQVLSELLSYEIARDPEVAPTLIQVTSQLAQLAGSDDRDAAAAQLGEWLRVEAGRESADARGNLSVLVEALASVNSPRAEAGLLEALSDEQVPLHVQTLAVEGLSRLGTDSAREALQRFRAQLSAAQREGFEAELQQEAEDATDRALARLSR